MFAEQSHVNKMQPGCWGQYSVPLVPGLPTEFGLSGGVVVAPRSSVAAPLCNRRVVATWGAPALAVPRGGVVEKGGNPAALAALAWSRRKAAMKDWPGPDRSHSSMLTAVAGVGSWSTAAATLIYGGANAPSELAAAVPGHAAVVIGTEAPLAGVAAAPDRPIGICAPLIAAVRFQRTARKHERQCAVYRIDRRREAHNAAALSEWCWVDGSRQFPAEVVAISVDGERPLWHRHPCAPWHESPSSHSLWCLFRWLGCGPF
jgi:hypothetical protein